MLTSSPPAQSCTQDGAVPLDAQCVLHVLIIDDNEPLATTSSWIIGALGDIVEVRLNGQAGLDALEPFKPDVVILDIGMPDMDGLQVCKAIRSNPAFDHIVTVAQTGYGDAEMVERIKAAGFNYHLLKPVAFEVLSETLNAIRTRPRHETYGLNNHINAVSPHEGDWRAI